MSIWQKAVRLDEIPRDSGGCVKLGTQQIAVFHYDTHEWYAVENRCPHQKQMVMARGLIGDLAGEPKIVCPLHKHGFSLRTGEHLGGNCDFQLRTFPVKEEGDYLFIQCDESSGL